MKLNCPLYEKVISPKECGNCLSVRKTLGYCKDNGKSK